MAAKTCVNRGGFKGRTESLGFKLDTYDLKQFSVFQIAILCWLVRIAKCFKNNSGVNLNSKRKSTITQKVQKCFNVIVEALKVDSLQKLCSSLEPVLWRVLREG
ncbi:hypothetical protein ACS0TY_033078 [Phlomoides rotata]